MKNFTKSLFLSSVLIASGFAQAQTKRLLQADDIFNMKSVGSPRISPEGDWVAYTVSTLDQKKDSSDTDIYMAPYAGGDAIRLTTGPKGESQPRWSPDGRYLAFLSARDDEGNQVWLLDRRGIDTELVIYPGQSHGIRRPSYQVDRYQRYIDWYNKYLKPEVAEVSAGDN